MKVKIAYTTEYHTVPDLVNSILNDCRGRFRTFSKMNLNPRNLTQLTKEVRGIREDLDLIDSQLEDSLNMMIGYHNVQEEEGKDVEYSLEDLETEIKNEEG